MELNIDGMMSSRVQQIETKHLNSQNIEAYSINNN